MNITLQFDDFNMYYRRTNWFITDKYSRECFHYNFVLIPTVNLQVTLVEIGKRIVGTDMLYENDLQMSLFPSRMSHLPKRGQHVLEVIVVDEPVSVLIYHIEGFLKFLYLVLVEHGEHVRRGALGTLLRARTSGRLAARHLGGLFGSKWRAKQFILYFGCVKIWENGGYL